LARGQEIERQFEQENTFSKIKRTGKGSDYEKEVTDSRGKKVKEKWEVKRNNSPLSKTQKQTKGLKVYRFRDDAPLGSQVTIEDKKGNELKKDIFTGKWKKVKKETNAGFSFFGSNSDTPKKRTKKTPKKRTTKKKSDSIWGSSLTTNFFGSNSDTPKKRTKKTPKKRTTKKKSDSIWGSSSDVSIWSSSSSKKKRKSDSIW